MLFASFVVFVSVIMMIAPSSLGDKSDKSEVPQPYWSEWGPWSESCSVTCGIGVKRRERSCITPGNNTKTHMKVLSVQRNRRCPGKQASQARNCDTKITCPVHGGWSAWSNWECTVSCDGGRGRRQRSCTNPKPMFSGKNCEGPSRDVGSCNEQPCPDRIYTLPPTTARMLEEQMRKAHQNYGKKQGASVRILCPEEIVRDIYKAYPQARVFWTKNGEVVETDNVRVRMSSYDLVLNSLNATDNGVYVCHADYGPGVDKPIAVAALTVWGPHTNLIVHEGDDFNLTCHGSDLAAVYPNLTQRWNHRNVVFMDFLKGSPAEHDSYTMRSAKTNMSGLWSCQITDVRDSRTWITNLVRLRVLPAIHFYDKVLSWRNILTISGISACLLIMSGCSYFSYAISKAKEESKVAFCKWCTISDKKRHSRSHSSFPVWQRPSPDELHSLLNQSDDGEMSDDED